MSERECTNCDEPIDHDLPAQCPECGCSNWDLRADGGAPISTSQPDASRRAPGGTIVRHVKRGGLLRVRVYCPTIGSERTFSFDPEDFCPVCTEPIDWEAPP